VSEKKPFDAAIAVLKTELRECSPDEEDEFCDFIQSLTDNQYEKGLRIAIRVLEAAEKVDKKKALELINDVPRDERLYGEGFTGSGEYSERKQIRALLESLLEKEEK